jgi:hypothetical protein
MKEILIKINHTDMSTVFFFDDTYINIKQALSIIPNSHKIDYESTHLFELLCEQVLPISELVYNVPIYDVDKINPPNGTMQYILRKTSQYTADKIIRTNNNLRIINVFTAVYSTYYKESFGVILDDTGLKRFVRFIDDDFKADHHTLTINRIRNLDEFMNYIHRFHTNVADCTEHKFANKNNISINEFI